MADMIYRSTDYILKDEPCFALSETNRLVNSRDMKRIQIVRVVRNDHLADYEIDLGFSKDFKSNQFIIPGGAIDEQSGRIFIEHTVGELQDIAFKMRYETPRPKGEYFEMADWQDKTKKLVFS